MDDTRRILQAIKERREGMGLTQKDIARVLGVTPGAYYKIESGERGMNLVYLLAICKELQLSLDEVLTPSSEKNEAILRNYAVELERLGISIDHLVPYIEANLNVLRAEKCKLEE